MVQELREYIEKNLQKGFKIPDIKNVLLKWGYSEETIEQAIQAAQSPQRTTYKDILRTMKVYYRPWMLYGLLGIVILALVPFVFSDSKCSDLECFVNKASKCKETTYVQNDSDIIFEFSSFRTENGCIFKEKVKDLPESEPETIKDALLGKKMTCNYTQGEFDRNWTNTLLGGLDKCKGELKNGLYEIALAQYNTT